MSSPRVDGASTKRRTRRVVRPAGMRHGTATARPGAPHLQRGGAQAQVLAGLAGTATRDERRSRIAPIDEERDVVAHASRVVLALGALGVVYGDIGTSPLYAEQVIFTQHAQAAHTTPAGVYGVTSLIFWALTMIVSIKYAGF